jgi:hypothetical protein
MSENLRKHAPFLKSLSKVSEKRKKTILKSKCCDSNFIKACVECVYNLLKGCVPMSSSQKKKISRKKKLMRKLVLKKTSMKSKGKIIQTGGFLGAILAPIVRVISGLFGGN